MSPPVLPATLGAAANHAPVEGAVRAELEAAQPVPRLAPKVLASRLAEWRRLLRGDVHQARAVLQRVLAGRVAFTAMPGVAAFGAPTKFSGLLSGFR